MAAAGAGAGGARDYEDIGGTLYAVRDGPPVLTSAARGASRARGFTVLSESLFEDLHRVPGSSLYVAIVPSAPHSLQPAIALVDDTFAAPEKWYLAPHWNGMVRPLGGTLLALWGSGQRGFVIVDFDKRAVVVDVLDDHGSPVLDVGAWTDSSMGLRVGTFVAVDTGSHSLVSLVPAAAGGWVARMVRVPGAFESVSARVVPGVGIVRFSAIVTPDGEGYGGVRVHVVAPATGAVRGVVDDQPLPPWSILRNVADAAVGPGGDAFLAAWNRDMATF